MGTSTLHEQNLRKYIKELEVLGYRVIDLERKSPDAIAIKVINGKIEVSAVEVLSSQYKIGKGWHKKWNYKAKISIYHMFDNILIKVFRYPLIKGRERATFPVENEKPIR